MSESQLDRRRAELEILQAMYPEVEIEADEITYSTASGSLHLRLPHGYLHDEHPEVIAATVGKLDARDQLRKRVKGCTIGEEILDSIFLAFHEELDSQAKCSTAQDSTQTKPQRSAQQSLGERATVVVYLHHLLNTAKRKEVLTPPSADVSGVSKPGYPGVLIFSGPASEVRRHVFALKQLNWQAFQPRLEVDEEWTFAHGRGVKEVETMKDVVAELGEEKRSEFLKAMRIK